MKCVNEKEITLRNVKELYNIIGSNEVITLFLKNPIEIHILKSRWQSFKSFDCIAAELNMPQHKIARAYASTVRKLQKNIIIAAKQYALFATSKKIANEPLEYKTFINFDFAEKQNLKEKAQNFKIEDVFGDKKRWVNILKLKNILVLGDLILYSRKELLLSKKMGEYVVNQIEQKLLMYGLKLSK